MMMMMKVNAVQRSRIPPVSTGRRHRRGVRRADFGRRRRQRSGIAGTGALRPGERVRLRRRPLVNTRALIGRNASLEPAGVAEPGLVSGSVHPPTGQHRPSAGSLRHLASGSRTRTAERRRVTSYRATVRGRRRRSTREPTSTICCNFISQPGRSLTRADGHSKNQPTIIYFRFVRSVTVT